MSISQVTKAGKNISDMLNSLIISKVGAIRLKDNDKLNLRCVLREWSEPSRHLDIKYKNKFQRRVMGQAYRFGDHQQMGRRGSQKNTGREKSRR